MPSVKALYMASEMPLTSLVLKVCQACGTKLPVARTAAIKPMASINVMARIVIPFPDQSESIVFQGPVQQRLKRRARCDGIGVVDDHHQHVASAAGGQHVAGGTGNIGQTAAL